jgi:outer membrane protein TolC
MWLVGLLLVAPPAFAQSAPPTPNRPWTPTGHERPVLAEPWRDSAFRFDAAKTYSLAELIDLAQRHNPDTRVAWERARAQAAALGVARSELYPTLAAAALARANRSDVLVENTFVREQIRSAALTFDLTYMVFDFGGRAGRIDTACAKTLAANFAFNDIHRQIIFQVSDAYYRLLNASGQEDAARASLANAQAVQRAAEERLQNGLATLPDVLEARSAAAQADYELQAALGTTEIAVGDLAMALGAMPSTALHVQPLSEVVQPDSIGTTIDEAINRAFAHRPDFMQQLAEIRAADARTKETRSAFYPTLNVRAQPGPQLLRGLQRTFPWTHSEGVLGWAGVSLDWTIFDGGGRSRALAEARASAAAARARAAGDRNRIANDVWTAYSQLTTALRRRKAASALLDSAGQSYAAALESYNLGLRNLLDVTAAQRTLAEARSADVLARTQALSALANLAFQTGDSIQSTPRIPRP